MLGENFRIYSVHITGKRIVKLPLPFHNAIISLPHVEQPLISLAKNVCTTKKSFFWRKVLPYLRGGDILKVYVSIF